MERKFKPKTGKEKGFQIAGAVCAILSIPHAIMMIIPFAIIVNLIFFLIFWALGFTFLMKSMKMIKARVAQEEANKAGGVKQVAEVEKPKPIVDSKKEEKVIVEEPKSYTTNETIKGDSKPIINDEEDPFEAALKKKDNSVAVSEESHSNKKVLAIIVPIITILVAAIIAIAIVLIFNKKSNSDDNGGGSGGNGGGSSKATFNITSTTYYEEYPYDGRIDGYVFKPNGEYIQYRFEQVNLDDPTLYVTWIEYGTWTYDSSNKEVHGVCTTYETYDDYTNSWRTNTYSIGASNSLKDFTVVSNDTLYWNGNSNFKLKKVSSFTHPIVKA